MAMSKERIFSKWNMNGTARFSKPPSGKISEKQAPSQPRALLKRL